MLTFQRCSLLIANTVFCWTGGLVTSADCKTETLAYVILSWCTRWRFYQFWWTQPRARYAQMYCWMAKMKSPICPLSGWNWLSLELNWAPAILWYPEKTHRSVSNPVEPWISQDFYCMPGGVSRRYRHNVGTVSTVWRLNQSWDVRRSFPCIQCQPWVPHRIPVVRGTNLKLPAATQVCPRQAVRT